MSRENPKARFALSARKTRKMSGVVVAIQPGRRCPLLGNFEPAGNRLKAAKSGPSRSVTLEHYVVVQPRWRSARNGQR